MIYKIALAITLLGCAHATGQLTETLPRLADETAAPINFEEMWAGFDPRAEPLEIETLKSWEEDGVEMRIVRFRIGVFKGQKAKLAAIYGYPKDAVKNGKKLPGLLQIHGGGQYADHKACVANARRGYATLSIAWAGRISAPGYRVGPNEVKLFWDGKTDDPNYKLTTDWGALDGYHAPSRNPKNVFPVAAPGSWTLDAIESPRNCPWFLCALAARRALTFLEQQPEVDAEKLGVYGHSMGGKLTVMTAVDDRVKAAAPSCGGISDRYNKSALFNSTIGDDVSLRMITCPIIFLSPSNDFHGRIGNLGDATKEIGSKKWRVTCSPHHNHQDSAEYEVATMLWFDQHLKDEFSFPDTPATKLELKTDDGIPVFSVKPDKSRPYQRVDIFYTQQGEPGETSFDRENVINRFWHHAKQVKSGDTWQAKLPIADTNKPLWVYANVKYELDKPVAGVGYYYGAYETSRFNVSSLLLTATPDELKAAGCKSSLKPSRSIEGFGLDWEKQWFHYKPNRPDDWSWSTHKVHDETWKAPSDATLCLEVRAAEANQLVIMVDGYAKEVSVAGGDQWQDVSVSLNELQNFEEESLGSWANIKALTLSSAEHLRSKPPGKRESRLIGQRWKGAAPKFRNLRWVTNDDQ